LILASIILCTFILHSSPVLATQAQDEVTVLRILWFDNANESDVLSEQIEAFQTEYPTIDVEIDVVPYGEITTILEQQIAEGEAPDLTRTTELGRFRGQYLDFRPYLTDAEAWERNFEPALLNAMRSDENDQGLYGYPTDITVSAPFINRTLFEQAGVPVPSDSQTEVSWDEWIEATRQVQEALSNSENPIYALSIDRSGHRFWGPSLGYCATYFDEDGNFNVDSQGFREATQMIYDWHLEGLTPLEIWAGGGADYRDAKDYFVQGETVFYFSGSWQVASIGELVGNSFDWDVVPAPLGPCGGSSMIGGSVMVALKDTQHPAAVGLLIDFLTREENMADFYRRTFVLPGSLSLIEQGLDYETYRESLNTFTSFIPAVQPEAYALQYHPLSGPLHGIIRTYLIEVMSDFITIDEAIELINQDAVKLIESQGT
jgi:alpha-1,4-digalacturonate transport system substrate-binding protein